MPSHLPNRVGQRAAILMALIALMLLTRSHLPMAATHVGAAPDASWAAFFMMGFYFSHSWRWTCPLFMVLAMAVDYAVITGQGIDFWSHYCVYAAYWCLIAAYGGLWIGGSLTAYFSQQLSDNLTLLVACLALVSSVALCYLISQGGFYWVSRSVTHPTVSGWWTNYGDWFAPFLRSITIYVGLGFIVHVGIQQLLRFTHPRDRAPQVNASEI